MPQRRHFKSRTIAIAKVEDRENLQTRVNLVFLSLLPVAFTFLLFIDKCI